MYLASSTATFVLWRRARMWHQASSMVSAWAGNFHRGPRTPRTEPVEAEVDAHGPTPPLFQVPDLGTDVEGNEHAPAGPHHAADLPESRGELSRRQVNDRVERDDGPELAIAGRQVKEIPCRNSVSGYARRAAATMPADRSIPTAARPWPAIQSATAARPHSQLGRFRSVTAAGRAVERGASQR
jgi:hypothetical protein